MPQTATLPLQEHVPLAGLTTFGVGGPARYFLRARDGATVRAGIEWARNQGLPFWILGGGSNVVVADSGLPGLVIQPAGQRRRLLGESEDGVHVSVEAGAVWDDVVAWAVDQGYAGLECLSGIPGLVGAAPIQNIGAYGQEASEVLEAVEVLDVQTGRIEQRPATTCGFGYRDSVFKRQPGRHVVLSVQLRLQADGPACLRYAQVAEALAGQDLAPGREGLLLVREAVLALRRSKAMVLDPQEPDSRSAGSFFMNPLVAPGQAEAVATRLAAEPQEAMPRWPAAGGRVKLSAAWLIERSGMQRGYGEGPVGLSRRHTLALVNRGEARAADVVAFAEHVAGRVYEACGVRLEREPVLLGF